MADKNILARLAQLELVAHKPQEVITAAEFDVWRKHFEARLQKLEGESNG